MIAEIVNNSLAALDVIAALVLIWTNQRITAHAGFSTPEARWTLFYRAIYSAGALAMFVLGVGRLNGHQDATIWEGLSHGFLIIIVITYPLLRAMGYYWDDTNARWRSLNVRGQRKSNSPDRVDL